MRYIRNFILSGGQCGDYEKVKFSKDTAFKGIKNILPLILLVSIFFFSLMYLHQKVQLYVEAYRLSNIFYCHNELIGKRDYLMYNFAKEATLTKINQWAVQKDFAPIDKNRMIALNKQKQVQGSGNNRISLLLSRIAKASAPASMALAEDKR